jgi:hypothetical protein
MTDIIKVARIVKIKNKYCVKSHKRDKNGKYRNFGCYDTKEEAKERLGQIYMFKHKKAELFDTIINISDELENKGMIHIADALAGCMEAIVLENSNGNTVLKLGKIINLLHKKGEVDIAEKIDAILPDMLCFEDCGCTEETPKKSRMSADRIYKLAMELKKKYQHGLIDEKSFEYKKMKEFESVLRIGFLLPPPNDYKELPNDSENWWQHFENRGLK